MLRDWVLTKLEAVKTSPRIVLRDPLHLLSEADGALHNYARENGYTVIVAATNLVFRELYEQVVADPETRKLLLLDRAPLRRRTSPSLTKAPPPFYPDLLAATPVEARIDLDLRQYLIQTTGDPNWPAEANDPRYARLMATNLDAVLRAHHNLRAAHEGRFTDYDFRTIVAFAALGVADSAFKSLDAEDYWRVGLLGYQALEDLEGLVPEITRPIRTELLKAPAPFCWFADHDPALVLRVFYLAVILAQHTAQWELLLAKADPTLARLTTMKEETLGEAVRKLVSLDPTQANRDLDEVERSLSLEALKMILVDHLHITEPMGFATLVEKERYSALFHSLALLMALDDLLAAPLSLAVNVAHRKISAALWTENVKNATFVEARALSSWQSLKEAYRLAEQVQNLRQELSAGIRSFRVAPSGQLTFTAFRDLWTSRRLNRLEYYLSALERIADAGDLLPRGGDLPAVFVDALARMRSRIRQITDEVSRQLDELNARFQDLVAAKYPSWVGEGEKEKREKGQEEVVSSVPSVASPLPLFPSTPVLTSQFLRRCLKPHWDAQTEKAVVLVFDGMRYDIWDELLLPLLLDRLEIVEDLPGCSLLPSETQITRKAISAGTTADAFDARAGEDRLLQEALQREFGYASGVQLLSPEGSGTGETVRYRAGNLDFYVFELCDKELHKISWRVLPDGRESPSRPLAFIYQQHLRSILDTEVISIIRNLAPGTKVFITADHGFGRVGRQPLWFRDDDLNDPMDCSYLNCSLRVPFANADIPAKVRSNVIAFTPQQLRMPGQDVRTVQKTGQVVHKQYEAIVFPKVGYSFSRAGTHYNPDAYSHGGISIQEMMIPMVALRVKGREEGLSLQALVGPSEVLEGEEAEFRLHLSRGAEGPTNDDLRVEVVAEVTRAAQPEAGDAASSLALPRQVYYVGATGADIVVHFRLPGDDATPEERRQGIMERIVIVVASYREGRRSVSKTQVCHFTVRLNSERIIRRVGNLGSILGLTPRTMR